MSQKRKREDDYDDEINTKAGRKREDDDEEPKTKPDRRILVAVDFGTTFSGVAWAQTRKPDVQTPIIQWPDAISEGLEGVTSDKVPTEIAYDGQNHKWGFEIDDSVQRHQWFKLDLDPSQLRDTELSSQNGNPLAAPAGYACSAEKLATDYLTALRQHTERILRFKLPESALASIPIEYIITVPAVWSDMAQSKTRSCAEKAGMGSGTALHIISEPEAAAIYSLDAMDPHGLEVGDTFVVCDAGGGTVDLITYTVSALKPVLGLTEASIGSGLLCGSSFLNRKFAQFLKAKLGDEPGWDDDVLEEAMKRFENGVKRQFCGTFGERFLIPVPGLADNAALGIKRGKMTLAGTEVRLIFEPVLNEVIKLVMEQLKASKKHVKAVLLVGGFGQSAYLRDSIRKEVKSAFNAKTEVMQPPNGWTAVVRGALMKGLASVSPSFARVGVSARSARKHYGITSGHPYIEGQHDKYLRYWDACDGMYRISLMDWFVKKGGLVEEEKPVSLTYYQKRKTSSGRFNSVNTNVYFSSDPLNSGAPKYATDSGVKKLTELRADLSKIPTHLLPTKQGADGHVYYKIKYDIQVTYYSAYTKYELFHNGINYGSVSAEYV